MANKRRTFEQVQAEFIKLADRLATMNHRHYSAKYATALFERYMQLQRELSRLTLLERYMKLSERQNQMTDTVYSVKKFGLIEIHIRKESILGPRIISVVAPSVPLTNPTPELLEEIGKTWLAAAEYLADLGPK